MRKSFISRVVDQLGLEMPDALHADPRTTRLYDRRKQMVTRSEVERIRYEKKKS